MVSHSCLIWEKTPLLWCQKCCEYGCGVKVKEKHGKECEFFIFSIFTVFQRPRFLSDIQHMTPILKFTSWSKMLARAPAIMLPFQPSFWADSIRRGIRRAELLFKIICIPLSFTSFWPELSPLTTSC